MIDAPLEPEHSKLPAPSNVSCVVLAAGASTRMGERNKLLEPIDNIPMVATVVGAALDSAADEVFVVTGEDRERVEACLSDLPVHVLWNPDHARGLSTSLKAGVSALPSRTRAVVVCLGDMPLVRAAHIDALIQAFRAHPGHSIFVPTSRGRRGNPVLWTVDLLPEVGTLTGDVGCRALMSRHPDKVREVPVDAPGILTDVDTPEALQELTALTEAQSR
jgi:molybdenum cofactor cytidylyltransferase